MTVYPHVKINLGLSVLGRREDGFHDIETLFVPYYGFRDTLTVEKDRDFSISISGPYYTGWKMEEDLCARAFRLIRERYGIGNVRIVLQKNSPVGAGLGGGSADAAFTLKALRELFSLDIDDMELSSLASGLGSDCAFFVWDRPMMGEGRGEVLSPFDPPLDGYELKVEVPYGETVSTAEAYAGIDSHRGVPAAGSSVEKKLSVREALARPVEEWKHVLGNDFEQSVFPLHPGIAELKEDFYRRGAVYASMSGSGSAVFGLFRKDTGSEVNKI